MQMLKQVSFVLLAWLASFQLVQAQETPDKVAGQATQQVLQLLKTERDVYKKDESKFFADVEKIIDPVVAFSDIARGVMGKYAHRSSDEEIKQFAVVFRDSLVRFYSKSVLTFDTSDLSLDKVEPVAPALLKEYDAGKSRSVPVNLTIRGKDQQYVMSYSMMQKDGKWMIRNIVVEGINIGIQFRNQFADAMNKYRKVETVIDKWPELMQQSEKDQQKEKKG
ncbi:MlaC/ttg2D family ABC transporter substrate-binding protein [Parendozoicomonas haliclonae]|uniref:Toluene tolerance, Ttg2 n=1 Tax=Parendozoicomonas haliclonae TaxID=1960125 RepID=A0A1X7AFA8_9GAMM|nr:ABC transporter substrate-binding protein [Parendozoicomonas haliclonae]SMA37228.1 Toluene tolerance, Ttg2 [Parendozoicomonas haliclonae]